MMTAAATFGSIALLRRQHPASAWWIAASPALLFDAAINWDLIGVAFLVAGVVYFGERRYGLSGGATALGRASSSSRWWWPRWPWPPWGAGGGGALDPRSRPEDRAGPGGDRSASSRALASWLIPFAVVVAVVMVPLVVLAPTNTLWFIRFNSLRSQKDSVWELAGRLLGPSAASPRVVNGLSLVVVMAALAYGSWRVWRTDPARQGRAVALATAVAIVTWMAVNKVWNPQYVLWVFAAGAVAAMPARFGVALGAVSVYDWWFEFGLRRPDHVGPVDAPRLCRRGRADGAAGMDGGLDDRAAPQPGTGGRWIGRRGDARAGCLVTELDSHTVPGLPTPDADAGPTRSWAGWVRTHPGWWRPWHCRCWSSGSPSSSG